MNLFDAAILGLVEGLTEYLPISSTGHLILTTALLNLNEPAEIKRAVDAYTILIQGGAILAVLSIYHHRVWQMIKGLCGRDVVGLKLAKNLFISFLPAAILGVMFADLIEYWLFYPQPVIAALALGGGVMLFLKKWQNRFFMGDEHADPSDAHSFVDMEHLTWRRALIIGLVQCLAMWPGTSRSMTTIVGGMFTGLRPREAAEYSFLLGLPTLGGACVYKGLQNALGDGPNMIEVLGWPALIVGFLVATLSAMLAVKWLVHYLSNHGVALFGWYRLALAAVFSIMIARGMLDISPEAPTAPSSPLSESTISSPPTTGP
ncbi:MAG: undecaprenyl-diphosphate phosphatase [Planctomycetota bacterium]|nr:undecaprenyl-diphosphate phosphatase [Planctomycetota bacterium]